jgi:protease I
VVIPGGFAPDYMRRTPRMVEFVREMGENGKIVAAICHGGWVLISAGIIKGRKVTIFFAIKDDVVNAGAEFLDREVVRNENIITSRNPDDLPAFCRTIIETLSS